MVCIFCDIHINKIFVIFCFLIAVPMSKKTTE
ncbi:hypothetical protein NP493_4671g00000 [Ridgeia piscesae]|uniref:Uncharacterized protein n=1 Tax=Ridgeia piscesae TaxID=27915 RepID=A0AAD9IY24_RIDPI|nr:hypothetical protein NP493_4671g00000 [Ridgeia piscesae]